MTTWKVPLFAALGAAACSSNGAPLATDAARDGAAIDAAEVVIDNPCDKAEVDTTTFSNGEKNITTTRWGLVQVAPTDNVVVEQCDFPANLTYCGPSNNCTPAGDLFPKIGQVCDWTRELQFFQGLLFVSCGSSTEHFDAQGASTGITLGGYQTVRVHKR